MSGATLGAPIGPDIPQSKRTRVYERVPRLHELLENGGWPGVVYAQVCVHNVARAAEREETPAHLRPIRGAAYFKIRGPKGSVDMALVGCGKPIPGAAPQAGARLFFTDGEVEQRTGHKVAYPIWFSRPEADDGQEVEVTSRTDRAGEGPAGDARVEVRHAPQRQRGARQEPKAGHRHRDVGGGTLTEAEVARRQKNSERMKALWAKRRAEAAQR